jgi:hypothetical protein
MNRQVDIGQDPQRPAVGQRENVRHVPQFTQALSDGHKLCSHPCTALFAQREPGLGELVKSAPDQAVEQHHHAGHHQDASG